MDDDDPLPFFFADDDNAWNVFLSCLMVDDDNMMKIMILSSL